MFSWCRDFGGIIYTNAFKEDVVNSWVTSTQKTPRIWALKILGVCQAAGLPSVKGSAAVPSLIKAEGGLKSTGFPDVSLLVSCKRLSWLRQGSQPFLSVVSAPATSPEGNCFLSGSPLFTPSEVGWGSGLDFQKEICSCWPSSLLEGASSRSGDEGPWH